MDAFEERLRKFLSHAYDIERELGGGGMSRVFVATDRSLGRKVVIKLLSPELTAGVNIERFRREIQVAARLQHPHIVTLLSAGEDGDVVYYTMPFIEGESLRDSLQQTGAMSVRDVVRILYDVADALAYAHGRGVIHRDIKPGNILRSGSHALVTDFGVAKALNAAMPSSGMTSTGVAIGTPAYMAPEQLAGDPAADHRLDLYALGLLAYELLIGKSPFSALSPQQTLAAQLTRDPEPLSQFRNDVPLPLAAIIMRCLAKQPDDRYPTAEALLTALDGISTASVEIKTATRTMSVLPAVKKRRGKFLVGGAAVVLLASMAAILSSKRPSSQPPAAQAQPPAQGFAEAAPPAAATTVMANSAPPVLTRVDSLVIEAAVQKQMAQAQAEAQAQARTQAVKGKSPVAVAPINADSLRKAIQRSVTDSVARANPPRSVAAVAPAEVAVAPAPSGKRRVAITEPGEAGQQAGVIAFSHTLTDALRGALDKEGGFILIDQDSVRGAMVKSSSREGVEKILQPDVLISPTYSGMGDTVSIIVSIRDLRNSSSFGIRVTSTKLILHLADSYVGPIMQSILKQVDDLSKAPSIYRK
ncbi:MAG: serine/threonine-protein kinase [Gemmatimonadaceae bacterium]